MTTSQFDAWESREIELDACETFELGNGCGEGQEPDWAEFVAAQSQAEWEAILLDPAYMAWCEEREAEWATSMPRSA